MTHDRGKQPRQGIKMLWIAIKSKHLITASQQQALQDNNLSNSLNQPNHHHQHEDLIHFHPCLLCLLRRCLRCAYQPSRGIYRRAPNLQPAPGRCAKPLHQRPDDHDPDWYIARIEATVWTNTANRVRNRNHGEHSHQDRYSCTETRCCKGCERADSVHCYDFEGFEHGYQEASGYKFDTRAGCAARHYR